MNLRSRVVLHEDKLRPQTTHEIVGLSGLDQGAVLGQVTELNRRLMKLFGYKQAPIRIDTSGAWTVRGIAGLVRLNSSVEIEIVPKFLDPDDPGWRSDFFLLAILVRTGHVLHADEISANTEDRGDIGTLVARALIRMHTENRRRPIRGYSRLKHSDFSFDGDLDWDSLLLPEADGYRLERLTLTRENVYNSVLKSALGALTSEVGEGDTRGSLRRLYHSLGPQPAQGRIVRALPQRNVSWSQAYSLSQLVLEGMGLDLNRGTFAGPGFVLSTWAAWQSLCEELTRRALPGFRTSNQHPLDLGVRANGKTVTTSPDIAVMKDGQVKFLIDAKYKTRIGKKPAIKSADLYESLAFLQAGKTDSIALLYPAVNASTQLPIGGWRQFDSVTVGGLRVHGLELQVKGLAGRGGIHTIAEGLRLALDTVQQIGLPPSDSSDELSRN